MSGPLDAPSVPTEPARAPLTAQGARAAYPRLTPQDIDLSSFASKFRTVDPREKMMRRLPNALSSSFLCLLLVGCGGERPPAQVLEAIPEPAPAVQQAIEPEPSPATRPKFTCEDDCLAKGQRAYEGCLTTSNDPEVCKDTSTLLEQTCLTENCSQTPLGECETRCNEDAKKDNESCVAEGNSTILCTTLATAKQAACQATCGETP